MMQVQKIFIAALALACVCGSAMAQTSCITAPSMQINATAMAGMWYESVRNPVSADPLSCSQVYLSSPDPQTLSADIQYSNIAGSPYMNVQGTWNVSLENFSPSTGYTVTTPDNTTIVYKLLFQDPSNYALVCGYTNASDPSTIFGVILTRDETYSPASIEAVASLMFGFPQPSWSEVNQTGCVALASTTTQNPLTTSSGSDNTTRTIHEVCTIVCTMQ